MITQVCEGCLIAKQTRNSFPVHASYRASRCLELLHVDLCGPINPVTDAGNRYFLLLVDDFSRVIWVYMLKEKSGAKEAFQKFINLAENQIGHKIKGLRSDRGGEFLSSEFKTICEIRGITRYFTAPYSPQQNGVVEWSNRMVMDMARSLLKSKLMLCKFWAEAVRHTIYILNRVQTKALDGIMPYEAWSGRKPNLEHIRVFGCLAHAKVTTHLKKLDDRSRIMAYLGVEPRCKAHRLFDPIVGKIIVSRDVVF